MIQCDALGGGSITVNNIRTNNYGEASGFIFVAPGDPLIESVVISALDLDPLGGVNISKNVSIQD